ncbi:DEAD/DEAH box helicase [Actinobaculum suis]|uniref:DEAD/DEAH box helicase n=2 Tax=Actinobaculum suis TaxID=1657 RepID=UPI0009F44C67|nr:DEAD/DEAH box helicase [Actinobaculum suis]
MATHHIHEMKKAEEKPVANQSLLIKDYVEGYAARGITLDDFQVEACQALARGRDVLVCAPTGSGKTVIAHCAVYLALAAEKRCVYTAPIKALSNQKYAELKETLGAEHVGLLTGDQAINREAQIIVVTTEVLRNMLLHADPEIEDFGYAILDEVHYLADPDRGPVWEETILSLPEHIRLASLSATIANAEELASWMRSVRGPTELIVSETRPVPLEQYVSTGTRLLPLYAKGTAPRLAGGTAAADAPTDTSADASTGDSPGDSTGESTDASAPAAAAETPQPSNALVSSLGQRRRAGERPRRLEARDRRRIISMLEERGMLPAIEFIFSRKGCDAAVEALVRRDITLTTPHEQSEIRAAARELRASLSESDLQAVGFDRAVRALIRGYGAHHAGVYPPLKELTEKLMERGLLRIVYATGTLALGIDMPVRSVVLEELHRWNGSEFVDLTATEYTQLIGRAGRRGKDKVGYAVVVANADTDPYHLADLGSGKVEPLLSAFQTSYNTVVNLLADRSYAAARDLVNRSFAQYQRNAELGGVVARMERIRRRIAEEEKKLHCDCGDLAEYMRLRSRLGRARKAARRKAKREYQERIYDSFEQVRPGMVYAYSLQTELFYGVVTSSDGLRARVVDWDGNMYWLYAEDLASEMRPIEPITMPHGLSMRDPVARDQVADSILDIVAERADLGIDRDLLLSWSRYAPPRDVRVAHHPCASCPRLGVHMREGQELLSLHTAHEQLNRIAQGYEDSAGRDFDATAQVLLELGVLQRDTEAESTPGEQTGQKVRLGIGAERLREIHAEGDLLIYSCLLALPEKCLDPAGMAGWASMFLGDDRLGLYPPRTRELFDLARVARREADHLRAVEERHGISRTPDITPGCADAFAAWAGGASLQTCLDMSRLPVGDFVGAARRLIDLLGQLMIAGKDTWVAGIAHRAREAVRRRELM